MITLIVFTAFVAPSVLVVSACMRSSRLSQAEERSLEYYDRTGKSVQLASAPSSN
ncbi:MAG: hypothetical protein R6X32_12040 [Chloroflexota bacterium]|jgi:hypothetical protein